MTDFSYENDNAESLRPMIKLWEERNCENVARIESLEAENARLRSALERSEKVFPDWHTEPCSDCCVRCGNCKHMEILKGSAK